MEMGVCVEKICNFDVIFLYFFAAWKNRFHIDYQLDAEDKKGVKNAVLAEKVLSGVYFWLRFDNNLNGLKKTKKSAESALVVLTVEEEKSK